MFSSQVSQLCEECGCHGGAGAAPRSLSPGALVAATAAGDRKAQPAQGSPCPRLQPRGPRASGEEHGHGSAAPRRPAASLCSPRPALGVLLLEQVWLRLGQSQFQALQSHLE